MNVTAKIGKNAANTKIQAVGSVLKKPIRELLEREARQVAISCAKSTQPYGTGAGAQTSGQNAVRRDIYRVYSTPGKAFSDISDLNAARGFYKAIKAGKITGAEGAQAILDRAGRNLRGVPISEFDGGAAHVAARNAATGRVSQTRPGMIVISESPLKKYVEAKQALVGFAKSAWANLARRFGGIRGLKTSGDITANWITRKDAPGTVTYGGDEQSPTITLTSKVRYADRVLPAAARSAAVAIARGRLEKSLEIAAKAELASLDRAA